MPIPTKQEIRRLLESKFDETDLRQLVETMGDFPYSHVSGGSPREKVFDLTDRCERQTGLEKLWSAMVELRPDLQTATGTSLPRSALRHYLESQIKDLGKVDLGGYIVGVRLPADLENLFVDPTITVPIPLQPFVIGLNRITVLEQQPKTSWKNLLDYGKRHIVLGSIGSGKTCLLQRIFLESANDSLGKLDAQSQMLEIPIYLPLRRMQLDDRPISNVDYAPLIKLIERCFDGAVSWPQLEANLGSLKLLCDGLHEVPEELRQTIAVMLKRFLSRYPSVTIIIAIRSDEFSPDWFDPNGSFYVSSIANMSRSEVGDLIHRLFGLARLQTSDAAKLGDVASAITSRSLNEIMTTPLAVTVGVLGFLSRPVSVEMAETVLRQRMIKLTLGEWDDIKASREGEPHASNQRIKPIEVGCYLAYHAFDQDAADIEQTEVSVDAVVQQFVHLGLFASEEVARRDLIPIMRKLCKRSELLNCSGSPLPQNYRFRRKSDVITMTSIYLVEQILAPARHQVLGKRLKASLTKWQPVALTTFDMLFLDTLAEANRFIDSLSENWENPKEYSQRLSLAASCLLRSGTDKLAASKQVIDRIVAILSDKMQMVDLAARIQLAELLGRLGDPRIGATVRIPEGKFLMGFDQFPSDRPVRSVRLRSFEIDVYPVTNTQYKKFIDDGAYQRKDVWCEDGWNWVVETGRRMPRYWTDPRFNKPNYPVVGVSWFEADAYARWVGKRLPTEAEWEKAARGPNAYYWPWGISFEENNLNCSDSATYIDGTTPIGTYPGGQSPYGVYDMAGTVSEWTADWYEPYTDQSPPDDHYGKHFKVRRGGGWGWDQDFARCTCRNASPRTADYAILGFRCTSN